MLHRSLVHKYHRNFRLKTSSKEGGGSVRYEGLEGDTVKITGQSSDANESAPNSDSFTVDDAVEYLGFGSFQIKLSLLTGLAWVSLCFHSVLKFQMSTFLNKYCHTFCVSLFLVFVLSQQQIDFL